MEEKIYRQQVQKQALAARVVDAQMPENHFNSNEHFLKFDFDGDGDAAEGSEKLAEGRDVAEVLLSGTADPVMLTVVMRLQHLLKSIEDHELLLEDKIDDHLNEEEERQAEEEFEKELAPPPMPAYPFPVTADLLPTSLSTLPWPQRTTPFPRPNHPITTPLSSIAPSTLSSTLSGLEFKILSSLAAKPPAKK